jgi:hypothetical protein
MVCIGNPPPKSTSLAIAVGVIMMSVGVFAIVAACLIGILLSLRAEIEVSIAQKACLEQRDTPR